MEIKRDKFQNFDIEINEQNHQINKKEDVKQIFQLKINDNQRENELKIKKENLSNKKINEFYRKEIVCIGSPQKKIKFNTPTKNPIKETNFSKNLYEFGKKNSKMLSLKEDSDSLNMSTRRLEFYKLNINDPIPNVTSNNEKSNNVFSLDESFRGKKLILIADDNEIINNVNKMLIVECLGDKINEYEIIQVYDGLEIIIFVLNNINHYNSIKFLLTDENMNYFNGSEAIKFIRILEKSKKLNKMQINCITCDEILKTYDYLLKSGADRVLTKPLKKKDVKNVFSNIDIQD